MNDNIISATTSTLINIEGLTIGSTYKFKYAISNIIYDKNQINEEELNKNNEISIFLSEIPNQIKNLNLTTTLNTIYPDKVKLKWDSLPSNLNLPILEYIITTTDISNSNIESEIEISLLLSSYMITSLIPGNKFSFTIKATN